jgi:hypothetical protein
MRIWVHFQYLCFKNFLMVYWGSNLDQIYYLHFRFKYLEHYRFSNHTTENHLVMLKLAFLHLWGCVWIWRHFLNKLSRSHALALVTCLSFGHKLKVRITIQNINGIGNLRKIYYFSWLYVYIFSKYICLVINGTFINCN